MPTSIPTKNGKSPEVHAADNSGYTALCTAAAHGKKEMANYLLENKANVNAMTEEGTTLHLAVGFNHKEIVELLIARGADLNVKNKYGDTSLSVALKLKYQDIADLLRQRGAKE